VTVLGRGAIASILCAGSAGVGVAVGIAIFTAALVGRACVGSGAEANGQTERRESTNSVASFSCLNVSWNRL
jgi:hypothetical protein